MLKALNYALISVDIAIAITIAAISNFLHIVLHKLKRIDPRLIFGIWILLRKVLNSLYLFEKVTIDLVADRVCHNR